MEGSEKILFTMSLFYFLCGNLVEKGSEGDEARGAALQQTEPGEEVKAPPTEEIWWAHASLMSQFYRKFRHQILEGIHAPLCRVKTNLSLCEKKTSKSKELISK